MRSILRTVFLQVYGWLWFMINEIPVSDCWKCHFLCCFLFWKTWLALYWLLNSWLQTSRKYIALLQSYLQQESRCLFTRPLFVVFGVSYSSLILVCDNPTQNVILNNNITSKLPFETVFLKGNAIENVSLNGISPWDFNVGITVKGMRFQSLV